VTFDLRVLGMDEDDLEDEDWRDVANDTARMLSNRGLDHEGVAPVFNDREGDDESGGHT
jgi:hypothetical protein